MASHMLAITQPAVGSHIRAAMPASRLRVTTAQVLLHNDIGGETVPLTWILQYIAV